MVGSMATNLEIVTHLIEDDGLQKIPEFCRINRFVRSRLDLKEAMKPFLINWIGQQNVEPLEPKQ